jgi:hypothetical protein
MIDPRGIRSNRVIDQEARRRIDGKSVRILDDISNHRRQAPALAIDALCYFQKMRQDTASFNISISNVSLSPLIFKESLVGSHLPDHLGGLSQSWVGNETIVVDELNLPKNDAGSASGAFEGDPVHPGGT